MQEDTTTEVKEVIIGDFKPKRKFLSFISAVNGARVRFNRDIAFVKGEKLSGTLEGVIFKITICDEGTINFDEVDTNVTDKAQRQRLIDDIDTLDVTGYAQKFVIGTIQFDDIDGRLCYLEVEHQKPIDVLRSIFGDDKQEEVKEEVELSERGMSFLDDLLGSSNEVETLELSERDAEILIDAIENPAEPNEKLKKASESYLEEQFRKMNEEKVNELKSRITDTTKEIINHKREISQAESKLKLSSEQLGVLETRLESMTPGDEPNGYVFFVSEEQKNELGLDESTKHVADKIADLLGLKKDVLFEQLTGGFYKIRIAKKDDITAEKVEVTKEILEKMSFDPMGKMSMETPGEFEYRGDLNWHQLVGKMIRNGFEQEPEFDKLCQSNSYDSKEELKEESTESFQEVTEDLLTKIEELKKTLVDVDLVEVETKTTSTEIKSKSVKTYNEETTLVVVGTIDHNDNRDVEITDDYTSFGVYIGDKVKDFYESDGFISIMTLPEFKKWQSQYPDAMTDGGGIDSFLLPNFKGTIGITAMVDGEFTSDFDLSDYIQHQDEMEDSEVFLTLPEGTEIMRMDNYHQVPVAAMRESKINKIIK
jgi:hypothetical protein